jgi:FAD/FMN-containing dehydrogenase
VIDLTDRKLPLPQVHDRMLAFGNGRSYGDVCLNEKGVLLTTMRLNHFIAFNRASGRIVCEAGVLLNDILDIAVRQGWFLPITPGTRFVTVGGAIANDVHGKNHHAAGSFGHHIIRLELLRSNGERIVCSPDLSPDWFAATVGGLGLTGLITWAELQLTPVPNPFLWVETRRFANLDAFWDINADAETRWPHTVAWIDCQANGNTRGRGLFFAGKPAAFCENLPDWHKRTHHFPFNQRISLVNRFSLKAFNTFYYHRPFPNSAVLTHYEPFFYPLDAILKWNRIYGRRGFYQYQCVLPFKVSRDGIRELLHIIARSGQGSFLAVLKTFGKQHAAGMLSFPRHGATLALDFPNQGEETLSLFRELDAVVRNAGGALYPAKDARMPSDLFKSGFPNWERFGAYVDPQFSSGFWRRVTEE